MPNSGVEAQDMSIFQLAVRRKKGVVIAINKWDLIEKETMTSKRYEEEILRKLAPFNDVPLSLFRRRQSNVSTK